MCIHIYIYTYDSNADTHLSKALNKFFLVGYCC